MTRQTFTAVDGPDVNPTTHAAVNTTTSRTNLWVPSLWTPINAFDMRAGKVYHLRAAGVISTTGTPTIIINPCFGQSVTPGSNIALGASTTLTLGNNLSLAPWVSELWLSVRAIALNASASTIIGHGYWSVAGASGASSTVTFGGTASTSADHTTAQGLVIDVTWGTSSASNTISAQMTLLQSLN